MDPEITALLARIAAALERLAPSAAPQPDFDRAGAFRHEARRGLFLPAPDFALDLELLVGVEPQKRLLLAAVEGFAKGLPANHGLLWGSRGAGKSSLAKAVVARTAQTVPSLKLIEADRDELGELPALFETLRGREQRFVVFCDDLSFEEGSSAAKSLKSALEGGLFGAPSNVLLLATSNRRHLAPERHDEARGLLAAREDAEETVSVSDRFGLWIGFPPMGQAAYLEAVRGYADRFGLAGPDLEGRALRWAQRRGDRSGRVAYQFIRELACEAGRPLPL